MISTTPVPHCRSKRSKRLRVEDCAVIRASQLLPDESLDAKLFGKTLYANGERTRVTGRWPDGTPVDFETQILRTRQRLGGTRAWFACPTCNRRAGCLYSPDPGQPFACRKCWRLLYSSQFFRTGSLLWLFKQGLRSIKNRPPRSPQT